jgi:hypothetical protein
MSHGVTRRDLFVIVEAGAATAAFSPCAVLSGGASHPTLASNQQRLEGNQLRVPLAAVMVAGQGTRIAQARGLARRA